MIAGSIQGDQRVLPPVRSLLVQLEDQLLHKDAEETLITVGLAQAEVYIA